MLDIADLASNGEWIKDIGDDKVIPISMSRYCYALLDSFENSMSTVEEVAGAVFGFFMDTESQAVVDAFNLGQLNFDKEQNIFIANLLNSWIDKKFYDLREFKLYVHSKQVLGNLIKLQMVERELHLLQRGFQFVLVILAIRLLSGFVDGHAQVAIVIVSFVFIVLVCLLLGYRYNSTRHKAQELEKAIVG